MGFIERVTQGTKKAVVDFGEWLAEIDEQIDRPAASATDKIARQYHSWHAEQAQRGGEVGTEPPDAIRERVRAIEVDRRDKAHGFGVSKQGLIETDLHRRYDALTTLLEAAGAAMDELRTFRRDYIAFCNRCGIAPDPIAIGSDAISMHHVESWKALVAHAKAQRAQADAVTARRISTPLVLAD